MDPLTHTVLGRFVTASLPAAAGVRGGAAAAVLGALSPDVDFVLMPMGWDIYLRAHEVGTHSAAGLVLTGLGSAALVRTAVRGGRFTALAALAVTGSMAHVAADVASGARLRPLWPVSDWSPSLPLVAMADPWVIGIVTIGALAYWRMRTSRRAAARATLVAIALFLAAKAVLLERALRMFDAQVRPAGGRVAEARWGSMSGWYVFERTATELRRWDVDALGAGPTLLLAHRVDAESALVRASRRLDTVRNFLEVHDLVFAVESPAGGSRRAVRWSDVRFCWNPEADADAGAATIACALWFGGVLEPDGRAVRQEVRVGSWVQTRAPPAGRRVPGPLP